MFRSSSAGENVLSSTRRRSDGRNYLMKMKTTTPSTCGSRSFFFDLFWGSLQKAENWSSAVLRGSSDWRQCGKGGACQFPALCAKKLRSRRAHARSIWKIVNWASAHTAFRVMQSQKENWKPVRRSVSEFLDWHHRHRSHPSSHCS